jgi:hypothetical protein
MANTCPKCGANLALVGTAHRCAALLRRALAPILSDPPNPKTSTYRYRHRLRVGWRIDLLGSKNVTSCLHNERIWIFKAVFFELIHFLQHFMLINNRVVVSSMIITGDPTFNPFRVSDLLFNKFITCYFCNIDHLLGRSH